MTTPISSPTLIAPSSAASRPDGTARTYEVRTFGCQMNVHDSERLSGSLESAGYLRADVGEEADVVVINTCAVRDNAAGKLYGTLGHLKSRKDHRAGMQIAVGGCLAQMDKQTVLDKAPWVDVVFGTHNMGSLPAMLERARHNGEAQLEILESLEVFPSTLPTRRESTHSGWVSISVGCNNTCTFCIVPLYQAKAEFFRTLGHPARIRVLELLAERDRPVHELRAAIDVEAPNLSHQLAVLRRTGLVTQRRSGGEVIYSLALPAVRDLLASARAILETKTADQGGLVDDITPAAALQ